MQEITRGPSKASLPGQMLALQRLVGNAALSRALAPAAQRAPEGIEQVWEVGPVDALTARDASIEARESAEASGLPGFSDGPQDAYRHALWSCLMAGSIGAGQAKEVGDVTKRKRPRTRT